MYSECVDVSAPTGVKYSTIAGETGGQGGRGGAAAGGGGGRAAFSLGLVEQWGATLAESLWRSKLDFEQPHDSDTDEAEGAKHTNVYMDTFNSIVRGHSIPINLLRFTPLQLQARLPKRECASASVTSFKVGCTLSSTRASLSRRTSSGEVRGVAHPRSSAGGVGAQPCAPKRTTKARARPPVLAVKRAGPLS